VILRLCSVSGMYERGLQQMNGHPLVLPLLEEEIYGAKANILDI
jgi:hypothetical protein